MKYLPHASNIIIKLLYIYIYSLPCVIHILCTPEIQEEMVKSIEIIRKKLCPIS